MPKVLQALLSIAFISYPILIYFGLEYFDVRIIGLVLVSLLIGRLLFKSSSEKPAIFTPTLIATIIVLVGVGIVFNKLNWMLFYPVVISVFFLFSFTKSLREDSSMIERFAIAMGEKPSVGLKSYTYKVTIIWCGFFVLNGSIALYTTLFTSIETWTLYNGLISYCLMGILFLVEFLVRPNHSAS